jgi:hypothetical protein
MTGLGKAFAQRNKKDGGAKIDEIHSSRNLHVFLLDIEGERCRSKGAVSETRADWLSRKRKHMAIG